MQTLTQHLAEFARNTTYDSIPPAVIAAAIAPIVDTIGVLYAGHDSDVGRVLREHSAGLTFGRDDGVVVGHPGAHVTEERAAIVNGALGHVLDYDDVLDGFGHPSVPLLAAILASAANSTLTGRELLTAYVIGIEVTSAIAGAVGPAHFRLGWHTTATAGSFGATAAMAYLRGLSVDETVSAFGLVASMAGGVQKNFGTMTKSVQAGLAARNGVLAVDLARAGISSSPDVLEGVDGFLHLYGWGESQPDRVRRVGNPWVLVDPGPSLKKYPCCFATHRAIDAILQIQARQHFSPEEVESITCVTPPESLVPLRYSRPANPLEAKFSLEYCIAAALVDEEITLSTFTDSAISRPEIHHLLPLITPHEDPRCAEPGATPHPTPTTSGFIVVSVKARGTVDEERVRFVPGTPERPLSLDEVKSKFLDCLRVASVDPRAAQDLLDSLVDLPAVRDVAELLRTHPARL